MKIVYGYVGLLLLLLLLLVVDRCESNSERTNDEGDDSVDLHPPNRKTDDTTPNQTLQST